MGIPINVARFAPSGHNRQPVQWTVIYDSDEVQRLTGLVVDWMRYLIEEGSPLASAMNMEGVVAGWEAGFDLICRKAPHLIVANANKDDTSAPPACGSVKRAPQPPSFQFSRKNAMGVWQRDKHASLKGVSWYAPAAMRRRCS